MIRRLIDTSLIQLFCIGAWHALHRFAPDAVTSPVATLKGVFEMLGTAGFWPHAGETAVAFVFSLVLAIGAGLAIGLPLGFSKLASQVAEPILLSFYSLPKVTLYPVILLIFGLGLPAKIAFGAIHGAVPAAIFAMNGVRHLPPVYARVSRAFHLSRYRSLLAVLVPAALPEIVTGMRFAFCLTLLGVMIGEMFASQRGLGFLLMNAIGLYDVPAMLAIILIIGAAAVAGNAALVSIERRLHHR
jgi:NitT/TauT family transport system permease protein